MGRIEENNPLRQPKVHFMIIKLEGGIFDVKYQGKYLFHTRDMHFCCCTYECVKYVGYINRKIKK